jgi:arylsulfatase
MLGMLALLGNGAYGEPARPNIILVMPDDVGIGDYACMGNKIIQTPAVDAFHKQSTSFTRFHVSPTCAPTRSALLSGRHEFKNGVTHTIMERERMSLDTRTLAQVLQSAGYKTGVFGKWHLGDEAEYRPEKRGFDEVYIHGGGGIGQTFPGSCGDAPGNTNIDPALWHNGKYVRTKGYCTDLFFDRAIAWMGEQRQEKAAPFFAFVSLNAAHNPLVIPPSYIKEHLKTPGISKDLAKFYAMVENVDDNFAKLLAKLAEWGIADNTLVIYITGDNGGTHGVRINNVGLRGNKGTIYEGGTRAVAMFRWPAGNIAAGRECTALSAHIDLFPTLATLAAVELPADVSQQIEGKDLSRLVKNPAADWPDRQLIHHLGRWPKGKVAEAKYANCAIQNSRFSLINNRELYDLLDDPGQATNVIDQHPQILAALRTAYDQWWQDVQPRLVNEDVSGPAENPMKVLYWKQFGKSPKNK